MCTILFPDTLDPDMDERVRSFFAEYSLIILLAGAGVVFLAFGIYQLSSPSESVVITASEETGKTSSAEIYIDIAGAVAKPGLYAMPVNARIADVIKKAGGMTHDADVDYISRVLNKAQVVKDGQKVFIPHKDQIVAGAASNQSQRNDKLINVNAASVGELESLPGVGTVTAEKIVTNRPYPSVEDLKTKKAVSNAVYEKIKDSVTVY